MYNREKAQEIGLKIKESLNEIKKNLLWNPEFAFDISEFHVFLRTKKEWGGDVVPYFVSIDKDNLTFHDNPDLKKKLKLFFKYSGNIKSLHKLDALI